MCVSVLSALDITARPGPDILCFYGTGIDPPSGLLPSGQLLIRREKGHTLSLRFLLAKGGGRLKTFSRFCLLVHFFQGGKGYILNQAMLQRDKAAAAAVL